MKIEEIEIHAGDITQPYKFLGLVKARVGAATIFSKTPTIENVNFKLREEAIKLGANAIIEVEYDRGMSATSWKALTATGKAVLVGSDDLKCPFCAEIIKRGAIKCRFCGSDLRPGTASKPPPPPPPGADAPSVDRTKVSQATAKCPCNHCDGHLEFPREMAGQTVECPHCHLDTVLFVAASPLSP